MLVLVSIKLYYLSLNDRDPSNYCFTTPSLISSHRQQPSTSKWCSLLNLLNIKWSRFIKYLTRTIWSDNIRYKLVVCNIIPYYYFTSRPMGPDNSTRLVTGVQGSDDSNWAIIFSIRENCFDCVPQWYQGTNAVSTVNCNLVQSLRPSYGGNIHSINVNAWLPG